MKTARTELPSTSAEPRVAVTGAPSRRRRSWRGAWVVVHRYVGLTIATFLVVAGLTGSFLAFHDEIDILLNPELRLVEPPEPGAPLLDPLVLRDRIAEHFPDQPPQQVVLSVEPGQSVGMWVEVDHGYISYFIDPYTGAVLGSRNGHLLDDVRANFTTFVYHLHEELALGEVGAVLLGIVSLLWTIDCFIGLYLTFPARRAAAAADGERKWMARWKPSWLVRGGSLFGSIFTFHRASGLWVWPLLFVFAWSSVGFNLGSAYYPVMNLLGAGPNVWADLPRLEEPLTQPDLDLGEALERARELMAIEAEQRGFEIQREGWLDYQENRGIYLYRVHSTHDVGSRYPGTRLWFDGNTGELLAYWAPTGIATGSTITSWLFALHMGTVGGVAYRIVIVIVGVLVAGLCVTGVIIWWRKLQIRRRARPVNRTSPVTNPHHPPTQSP